jgi:hypothetical protein
VVSEGQTMVNITYISSSHVLAIHQYFKGCYLGKFICICKICSKICDDRKCLLQILHFVCPKMPLFEGRHRMNCCRFSCVIRQGFQLSTLRFPADFDWFVHFSDHSPSPSSDPVSLQECPPLLPMRTPICHHPLQPIQQVPSPR